MAEITRRRTGEFLRELFTILMAAPEGLRASEALQQLASRLAGVNYLGRPATTILAGGGGEVLVSVVEVEDAVVDLLSGFPGERSEPCLKQSSGSGGQVTGPRRGCP